MNDTKQIITQIVRRTKIIIALTVMVLSTLMIASPAFAGDAKVIPGSACLPASASQANTIDRDAGQALNISNSMVDVSCPVIRDTIGSADDGDGPVAAVWVSKSTSNSDAIVCDLRSYRRIESGPNVNKGERIAYRAQQLQRVVEEGTYRFADKKGYGVINWSDLEIKQVPVGAFEIQCSLPPGGAVEQYEVAE